MAYDFLKWLGPGSASQWASYNSVQLFTDEERAGYVMALNNEKVGVQLVPNFNNGVRVISVFTGTEAEKFNFEKSTSPKAVYGITNAGAYIPLRESKYKLSKSIEELINIQLFQETVRQYIDEAEEVAVKVANFFLVWFNQEPIDQGAVSFLLEKLSEINKEYDDAYQVAGTLGLLGVSVNEKLDVTSSGSNTYTEETTSDSGKKSESGSNTVIVTLALAVIGKLLRLW